MKAMILAAGRGTRMRHLTQNCPKPLLPLVGKPLIVHHLEKLRAAGFSDVVINHAYLGEQIEQTLGDGSRWDLAIQYSPEASALETAGGIKQALPLLGEAPFALINGDVWCDLDYRTFHELRTEQTLAQLILIDNPAHHPEGDFQLDAEGTLHAEGSAKLTYSGLAVLHPKLLADVPEGAYPLAPVLKEAMAREQVGGMHFRGHWCDVGTPERLQQLEQELNN